jgi:excisionase family DNA binding protein
MTFTDNQRMWTRREAAQYLGLTERTIDMLRKRGRLPDVNVVGRSVRFRGADVMRLIVEPRS